MLTPGTKKQDARRIDKPAFPVRQPTLRLIGEPESDRLQLLNEGHPLYAMAASVYHHQDELSAGARYSLLGGLIEAWPRKQGPPKGSSDRFATLAVRAGASIDDVVATWDNLTPESARRKVRRGGEPRSQPVEPRVVVADVDDPRFTLREPLDPGADEDRRVADPPHRDLALHRLPPGAVAEREMSEPAKMVTAVKLAATRTPRPTTLSIGTGPNAQTFDGGLDLDVALRVLQALEG